MEAGVASARLLKTIADLKLLPVWVNPDHLVSSARILMAGHGIKAVGVVDQKKLVGIATSEILAAAPQEDAVADHMAPLGSTVSSEATIRQAAVLMVSENLDHLPVVESDQFLGMVSAVMLLTEIGRTWDPLTGLPWSDQLREWGVEQLRSGLEVVIVFVDLDEFGQYNKRYGHIVGDRVLQGVADLMRDLTYEPDDLLVRYGGDEFAIGTTRNRSHVDKLVQELDSGLGQIMVGEVEEPVKASIGVFGGRRTHERENIHFAATLDSLINSASKDAQAQKSAKQAASLEQAREERAGAQGSSQRGREQEVLVIDVGADDRTVGALTTVMLSKSDTIVSGVHSRGAMPMIESVVRATLKALERIAGEIQFILGEVRLSEDSSGKKVVAVSGQIVTEGKERPASAVRRVEGDIYIAAAQATIDAVLG